MINKIEETRNYLIEKYGEPIEQEINGMKHRFVNVELTNFDKLIDAFVRALEAFKFEMKEEYISILCDFAITEAQQNVYSAMSRMDKIAKEKQKGIHFAKKRLEKALNMFEEMYYDKNYDPRSIMSVFVEVFQCQSLNNKGYFKCLM